MCDPATLSIAGFAVSAAQSVAGYMSQQAQYEIQQQQYAQNKANVVAAFQDKQIAYNNNEIQQQVAAANDKFNVQLQAQQAESKALVAAGQAGVSGTSIDQMIGDLNGRAGRYDTNVDTQLKWTNAQLESEKTAAGDQAVSQINSVNPGVPPNFLDAGIRIAAGGLGAYNSYANQTGSFMPNTPSTNPINQVAQR